MGLKTIINYHRSKRPILIKDNKDLVIMSFNIRCTSKLDKGIRNYKVRMPYIRKVLEKENPDVIGFQEVKVKQYKYLLKILKKYDYEYRKRDDTKEGESNPIFFKKNRFTCNVKETFWLSDTPQVMSNTFGGKCFRVCCYVKLKDKESGRELYVFNTHLDHRSPEARIKGIKLIKKIIKRLKLDVPYLIIGDMNDFYKSAPINELFADLKDASKFNKKDKEITFHDYGRQRQKIDYIAISKGTKQLDYKVITTKFGDIYPSDHYPIEVTIKI